jgi:2-polyprenyl-6-methoxyphenol hydroxylase-like FAD-dependent oxidoreductase
MMVGVLGAWRLGWPLAMAAKEDPRSEELLFGYEREQRAASEEVQNANARIFWNMALASPAAAVVRSAALRTLSHLKPAVRRMTEKEALVTQRLRLPDASVRLEASSPSGGKAEGRARETASRVEGLDG